jgi:hypothetical protein
MHLTEFCIDEDDKFGIHVWWKQEDSIINTGQRHFCHDNFYSFRKCMKYGRNVLGTFRSFLNSKLIEALICALNWLRLSLSHSEDLYLVQVQIF